MEKWRPPARELDRFENWIVLTVGAENKILCSFNVLAEGFNQGTELAAFSGLHSISLQPKLLTYATAGTDSVWWIHSKNQGDAYLDPGMRW